MTAQNAIWSDGNNSTWGDGSNAVWLTSANNDGRNVPIPALYYKNIFRDDTATVTFSSEQAENPGVNAIDWKEFTYWIPGSATAWAYVTLPSAQPVDYCAFFAHDFGSVNALVKFQYYDGGSWTDLATYSPQTTEAVVLNFDEVTATQFRFYVQGSSIWQLGVLSAGQSVKLDEGVWGGHTPVDMGRSTLIENNETRNGKFIGRKKIRNGWDTGINFDVTRYSWVQDNWIPFQIHAEIYPFFWKWVSNIGPDVSAYCWATQGGIGNASINGTIDLMSGSLNFRAEINDDL